MRRPLVAGNWKMNGSRASVARLVERLVAESADLPEQLDVAVFPTALHLSQVAEALRGSRLAFGVQNVHPAPDGAFTGEISARMAQDLLCTMVLAGHSERRSLFGESDQDVAAKVGEIGACGMAPVLCLGETLEERQQEQTLAVVEKQLGAVLGSVSRDSLTSLVVAYEPVWAIGTGLSASPQDVQKVHAFIRQQLDAHDAQLALRAPILYGGSIKPDNAAALFAQADVDGGLVGGASLDADDFLAICRAVA